MQRSPIPGGPWQLQDLQELFPWVNWHEPKFVAMSDSDDRGYACPVCVANHGLKAEDIVDLPKTPEAVIEHIEEEHMHVRSR